MNVWRFRIFEIFQKSKNNNNATLAKKIVSYCLCCIYCNPLINSWVLFEMQSAGNISVNILQTCAFRLRGNPCDWWEAIFVLLFCTKVFTAFFQNIEKNLLPPIHLLWCVIVLCKCLPKQKAVDIAKIQKWCLLRRFIDPILTDWLFEPSLGLTEKSNNFITVQAMTPSLANCPKNYLGTV